MRLLVVLWFAFCVTATITNAQDTAAAGAWSHLQELNTRANDKVPIGTNAVEFYAERNQSLHAAAAEFAQKFPSDVHAPQAILWKLDSSDVSGSNDQRLALFRQNEADARSIEENAEVPANLRYQAEHILLMQWLDNSDLITSNDQAVGIENRIGSLLQKNPQEPRAVTFQLGSAELMLRFDQARGLERLKELAKSPDQDLAAAAAVQLNKAHMIGKPLKLQFTAIDGSSVDVSGLHGKVVLIDFWASWCPDCIRETPTVRSIYQKYKDKGFEIIGISLDKDQQAMSNYIAKKLIPWPQYFDGKGWNNDFAVQFGVREIPQLWLINQRGEVIALDVSADQLEAKLVKLIAGDQQVSRN